MTGIPTDQPEAPACVALESESVRVTLLPDKGFDIYELIDRASGTDVLFKTPWGWREPTSLPALGSRMADWLARYAGGWQVLLPTSGGDRVAEGSPEGFHGEAAIMPWTLRSLSSSSATATLDLLTAPLRIERTVTLVGTMLTVEETVTNLSPVPQRVHWVHHPAFGEPFLSPATVFDIPAESIVTEPGRGDIVAGSLHPWPLASDGDGGIVDLSRMPGRTEPREIFGTLVGFREGRYAITNPDLGLRVEVTWDLDLFPYAWFWQELEATEEYPWFRRAYVTAVEPASLIPGTGETAGWTRGRLVTIEGHSARSTTVTMSLTATTAGAP